MAEIPQIPDDGENASPFNKDSSPDTAEQAERAANAAAFLSLKREVHGAVTRRAYKLDYKTVYSLIGEDPFILAGGAVCGDKVSDFDLYAVAGHEFDLEAIELKAEGLDVKILAKTKNALRFVFPVKWFVAEKLRGVRKLRGPEKPGEGRAARGQVNERSSDRYVDHVVEEPLLHGSCYIFSKDFIKRHPDGCFYNKTFMYMEAEILYYQARRDGEKMIYDPGLRVDHHEDVATDATFKKQSQKSVFTVKCMLQSTKAFLDLMDRDGNV